MIRINLLEGVAREAAETPEKPAVSTGTLQTQAFGGALILAGTLVVAAHTFFGHRLDRLNEQVEVEKRQAAALSAIQAVNTRYTAELQDIERRVSALQALEDQRQGPGQFMAQLATVVNGAPGLYLINVSPKGPRVNVDGSSTSVNSIALLLRTLQSTFQDVQLHEFYEEDDKEGLISFRFNLDFAYAGLGPGASGVSAQPVSKPNAPPAGQASHAM